MNLTPSHFFFFFRMQLILSTTSCAGRGGPHAFSAKMANSFWSDFSGRFRNTLFSFILPLLRRSNHAIFYNFPAAAGLQGKLTTSDLYEKGQT